MPDVAVVIPCYNAERFLREALDSVLSQTRPVTEILVVDDGSTDSTAQIASSYMEAGHPLRLIRTPKNGGPGDARNLGVASTDAELIAFLDADDRWDPDHLRTVVGLLERFPHAVVAYGECRGEQVPLPTAAAVLPSAKPVNAFWPLLLDNVLVQSAAVARRDAILKAGGYRAGMRYAEDYDLWVRMALLGPFVTSGKITCVRRIHDEQASRAVVQMIRGAWAARRRARSRFEKTPGSAELARVDQLICEAFERDLDTAWRSRRRYLVGEVLRQPPHGVQGVDEIVRRWSRRLRFVWPAWRVAAGLWDGMPSRVQHQFRRLRPVASPLLATPEV